MWCTVHGAVRARHFRVSKTLAKLCHCLYWPGCRLDVEIFIHYCDACTANKGPSSQLWVPIQLYVVEAPMERVGVDNLCPFPKTELGNCYVYAAMYYFTKCPEVYIVAD